MKLEVLIDGTERAVEIERQTSGCLRVGLDGVTVDVDATEIASGVYSILLDGGAFEARVLPVDAAGDGLLVRCAGREFLVQVRDPRAWRGRRKDAVELQGRQPVTAPMPGKVIRILVAGGETVEVRQGLVVVEAMKMQNEIRAPKSGTVERVCVREGQTVSAGESLVIIA